MDGLGSTNQYRGFRCTCGGVFVVLTSIDFLILEYLNKIVVPIIAT